jgi:2-polyprenyl-3-methyl-5-hydroxy-6-metoxy-1,4-benzoquinol methylase
MAHANTDKPRVAAPDGAFGFGRNWQAYVNEHLTPEREGIAQDSLVELLGDRIAGKRFLDIGSGSGLFSLGAHRLGAAQVVSIDVDPDSVASTRHLRERAGAPASWVVRAGSILDDDLVAELEPADLVYSWGVLHHTGEMWKAIENAASLVKPGGWFVIAIYNDAHAKRLLNSRRWIKVKRLYNRAPRPLKRLMELAYYAWFAVDQIRQHNNPVAQVRRYRHERGMAFKTDVIDWLGGYPYEFATADEIVRFCEGRGFAARRVVRVADTNLANNEFVFERR